MGGRGSGGGRSSGGSASKTNSVQDELTQGKINYATNKASGILHCCLYSSISLTVPRTFAIG